MKTIAIIDDCKSSLWMLEYLLTLDDCKVIPFSDTNIAIKNIPMNMVDVVISDFIMFDMDGFTFIENIKPLLKTTTKFVICSAFVNDNIKEQCSELNIYFLPKPYDREQIKQLLTVI